MKRRRNPVPASSRVRDTDRAARLYEKFSGHDAEEIGEVPAPKVPKVAVAIGSVDAICYTTRRDGKVERYIHEFKPHARPIFAVSPDGSQILLIGGRYTFTERGIVDKRKHRK
jgi:hypothetical protein